MADLEIFGIPYLAKGSGIHIKKENRGKFTETKKRTGKTTEELTHSKNPLTRKEPYLLRMQRNGNIKMVAKYISQMVIDQYQIMDGLKQRI